MEIPKINFKTISNEHDTKKQTNVPMVTLYCNALMLSKAIIMQIKGKYEYATLSAADSYLAIEFSANKKPNSFEIKFNTANVGGYTIEYARIGASQLSSEISRQIGLDVDKNKYFNSIDYKIVDNIMYFQFDKNCCKYRRTKK